MEEPKEDIELTVLNESPKFPRHRTASEGSSTAYDGDESTPTHTQKSHHTTETSPNLSLNDSVSPTKLDTTINIQNKPKMVDIRTSRGNQFSVAPKDASLLGRIAHKAPKKTRVLQPHEVFVELEELKCDSSSDLEWEETARWIKFEEDVEQEVGRWGRPHVSALAFHSLVDLRKGLDKGCVLLDVEGSNFPAIVDRIVEHLVDMEYLAEDKVSFVVQALYKKHKHQHHVTLWEELKHAAKSADGKLHDLGDQLRHRYHHQSASKLDTSTQPAEKLLEDYSIDADDSKNVDKRDDTDNIPEEIQEEGTYATSIAIHNPENGHKLSRSTQDLLDKIPDGAESITVLVGGVSFLQEPLVVFVRLQQSHLLGNLTEVPVPVRFIYLTLGPRDRMDYHEVGRAMATLMSDKHFHDMAYMSSSKEELLDAIDQFLDDSLVLPPGDWDQDLILPLMHERNELIKRKERKLEELLYSDEEAIKFSCKPVCGGLIHDIKNLVKRYPSDIKDVFRVQPFISIVFIYISCIAPAIAFGGLMEEITSNSIGETETLVGTGLCGIIQGLFSVQPLAILAFTGPLLLFEEIIIEFAHLLHIEYLPWRATIGLWVMIVVLIFGLSGTTILVKNFTRFSEEIFTGVIAIFFVVETSRTIVRIFQRNPVCGIIYPCGQYAHCTNTCDCSNMTDFDHSGSGMTLLSNSSSTKLPHSFNVCNQVNTALWSVFLCFGVFMIAVLLRKFRQSQFLGKQARRLVSDFGMLTALVSMVILAFFLRNTIATEVLVVPDGWKPSNSTERGWVINPIENLKVYHIIGAIVPAILLGILVFIENQLTLFLVNKPEHRLKKKGAGYHFDLCIVAILMGVCGVLGLPWHCAAPIRSIQHVQSLSYYSRKSAPGEKPMLEGVHEQRITNIVVHVLIVLSPFAYYILREIPFACLSGVFLYLAYASLSGMQLRKRLKLFFMPPKHHPDLVYVRKVRTWKMNLFTVIQVVLIAALLGLKFSPAGMFYPLAIVLLVPLRKFLGKYVFSHVELEALDSEEDFPDGLDEVEFAEYKETHVPY